MKPIQVGTCGWSYKDWSGHFYPHDLPEREYLGYYAERFQVVEVDSTFYHSPAKKLVQGWYDRTPERFSFSLKVPQVISHEKILVKCETEVEAFAVAARLLKEKLSCCLLQFGYFNKKAFATADDFLERLSAFLAGWPKDLPLAVEIRNKNWMKQPFADCLRKHNAVWALADQAWVPAPSTLMKDLDVVTGPFGYVRLLGDRAAVDKLTDTLDHIVIDRAEQISQDAQAIRLLSKRVPVLAFVNNHFAGYAPETIRQLLQALE